MFLKKFKSKAINSIIVNNSSPPGIVTYSEMVEHIYNNNPYARAAINLIVNSALNVDIKLMDDNNNEIESHPILDLLEYPNAYTTKKEYTETVLLHLMLDGNHFSEINRANGKTVSLIPLRPDLVNIRWINSTIQYEYVNNSVIKYNADEILHIKTNNPKDNLSGLGRGVPYAYATRQSVDLNNNIRRWNDRLMYNSAVPSGILEPLDKDVRLTQEQAEEISRQFSDMYSGVNNVGKIPVLSKLTWKSREESARELDWIQGLEMTAREISESLGVSSILLDISKNATYNNYREAKEMLYYNAVFPLLERFVSSLNLNIVFPEYDNVKLVIDELSVEVIRQKTTELWDVVKDATFLTENEKRELLKLGKAGDELDVYRIPNKLIDIPEDGGSMFDDYEEV